MASKKLRLWEVTLFALLGALMFASKQALEFLPNVHMLAMFTVLYTLVFRVKALIPIYVFVLLEGIIAGFSVWWIPYFYLWTVLWGFAMLIPRNLPPVPLSICLIAVCAFHGLIYGTLYAPFQALYFGLSFKGMIAWIITGLPWDFVHCVSNLFMGALIYPVYVPFKRVMDYFYKMA